MAAMFSAKTVSALEEILLSGIGLADGDEDDVCEHAERLAAVVGTSRSSSHDEQDADRMAMDVMNRALEELDRHASTETRRRSIAVREQDLQLAERDPGPSRSIGHLRWVVRRVRYGVPGTDSRVARRGPVPRGCAAARTLPPSCPDS